MLMVSVPGWSRKRATLKHTNVESINMETADKYLLKHKLDYLKLALKISKLRYHGDEPPKEILKQAHKLGRLAGISKEELENL